VEASELKLFRIIKFDLFVHNDSSYSPKDTRCTGHQVLVAHAYNSSYWGGKDQVDYGLKLAPANSLHTPLSKIPNTKKS
jgi:hypothetical protein